MSDFKELKNDLDRLESGSKVLDPGFGTVHLCTFINERGFEAQGLDPFMGIPAYAKNFLLKLIL